MVVPQVTPLPVKLSLGQLAAVPSQCSATSQLEAAARQVLGEGSVDLTEQSLGGEDFAWYLTKVSGAMARLGTREPGGRTYDIHQGDLQVDEGAIDVGVRLLTRAALLAGDVAPGPIRPTNIPNP